MPEPDVDEPDLEDDDLELEDEPVAVPLKAVPEDTAEAGLESDEAVRRYRMPDTRNREMFAIADQLMGASKIKVMCEDGKSRLARIPGKMKRRMWIKPGDLMIIKPWDFQDDKSDVVYRYVRTQSTNLSRRKKIPELLDVGF